MTFTSSTRASGPVGGMRIGNRVNEGRAESSVCLYLPDGRLACRFERSGDRVDDAFDAGGLRYDVVEPFMRVDMTYDGELMVLGDPSELRDPATMFEHARRADSFVRFEQTAASPVHGGEPTSPAGQTLFGNDFSRSHFNQHTRVVGRMPLGVEEWTVDGFGWRHHSWGPRYWQAHEGELSEPLGESTAHRGPTSSVPGPGAFPRRRGHLCGRWRP